MGTVSDSEFNVGLRLDFKPQTQSIKRPSPDPEGFSLFSDQSDSKDGSDRRGRKRSRSGAGNSGGDGSDSGVAPRARVGEHLFTGLSGSTDWEQISVSPS